MAQKVDIPRFLTLKSQCRDTTANPAPPSPHTFSQIKKLWVQYSYFMTTVLNIFFFKVCLDISDVSIHLSLTSEYLLNICHGTVGSHASFSVCCLSSVHPDWTKSMKSLINNIYMAVCKEYELHSKKYLSSQQPLRGISWH